MTSIWATTSALLAATAMKAVTGLQLNDAPTVDDKLNDGQNFDEKLNDGPTFYDNMTTGAGSVAALDPQISTTDGRMVHVTVPGNYLMVGIPSDLDTDLPASAQLMVESTFAKLTTNKCEDLMMRSYTIQGFTLGTNITKLEFFVAGDTFPDPINSTTPMGLKVTNKRENGMEQTLTFTDLPPGRDPLVKPVDHFSLYAVYCTLSQPKGYLKKPTKYSFRQRQPLWIVECKPNYEQHKIRIVWNAVWRGVLPNGRDNFKVDMGISISDVGTDPAGLMGTVGDYSAYTAAIPGCNKTQPVDGPFKYIVDGVRRKGPKGKPHRRHLR